MPVQKPVYNISLRNGRQDLLMLVTEMRGEELDIPVRKWWGEEVGSGASIEDIKGEKEHKSAE